MIIVFYILLGFGGLWVLAYILDYIKAKRTISKRGNKYISFIDFNTIVQAFPFYKEERYNSHIEKLDPLTSLLLDSCGYDCHKFETYNKWKESINEIHSKYVYNSDFNYEQKFTKEEMLEFIDSDKFDTFSNWMEFPEFVINYVLDLDISSNYSTENPIKKEVLEKVKIKLQDDAIKEKIFSNKKLKEHILLKIEAIKTLLKKNQDEKDKSYLEMELQIAQLALNSAAIKDNMEKRELMSQYN